MHLLPSGPAYVSRSLPHVELSPRRDPPVVSGHPSRVEARRNLTWPPHSSPHLFFLAAANGVTKSRSFGCSLNAPMKHSRGYLPCSNYAFSCKQCVWIYVQTGNRISGGTSVNVVEPALGAPPAWNPRRASWRQHRHLPAPRRLKRRSFNPFCHQVAIEGCRGFGRRVLELGLMSSTFVNT